MVQGHKTFKMISWVAAGFFGLFSIFMRKSNKELEEEIDYKDSLKGSDQDYVVLNKRTGRVLSPYLKGTKIDWTTDGSG